MSVRILTIVGARPQFIKASVVTDELRLRDNVRQTLVHTGQHHDSNMSQVFFDELDIPEPDVNLGISGGSHAEMTARMLVALEDLMKSEAPDRVLLYGDTNSTLAGALAAAKLNIPICHAEAGARTRSKANPEEINRICTDHLASINCAPTRSCLRNLQAEDLQRCSFFTGDLMYDAFLHNSAVARKRENSFVTLEGDPFCIDEPFCYLTCHRQENTDQTSLKEIFTAVRQLSIRCVYPLHPRMRKLAVELLTQDPVDNLVLLEPVGYLESLMLLNECECVVTDSGGLQREAFFAQKKCVTLLPFPSAEELLRDHRNTLVPIVSSQAIVEAVSMSQSVDAGYKPFGDGNAAKAIVDLVVDHGQLVS